HGTLPPVTVTREFDAEEAPISVDPNILYEPTELNFYSPYPAFDGEHAQLFDLTPGANDTFTATTDWGDGTVSESTVDLFNPTPTVLNFQSDEVILPGTDSYDPTTVRPSSRASTEGNIYWTFGGTAGLAANQSDLTYQNPDATVGSQVAFIRGTGSFQIDVE